MAKRVYAVSFRDLSGYKKSRQLAAEIYRLTMRFPREETCSLTDQIRRSSRSIGAQIAEAWGKRRYEKSFISKLTDADSEQLETQHWIEIALDCNYLDVEHKEKLIADAEEVGRIIGGMIAKAHLFCNLEKNSFREETADYFVSPFPSTDHP